MSSRTRAHTVLFFLFVVLPLSALTVYAKEPQTNAATLSGYLWYDGAITAPAEVALFDDLGQPPLVTVGPATVPGPFTIANVPDGTYYLTAFLDVSGTGGPPEVGEPAGARGSTGWTRSRAAAAT